jgi:hypothetical protein
LGGTDGTATLALTRADIVAVTNMTAPKENAAIGFENDLKSLFIRPPGTVDGLVVHCASEFDLRTGSVALCRC